MEEYSILLDKKCCSDIIDFFFVIVFFVKVNSSWIIIIIIILRFYFYILCRINLYVGLELTALRPRQSHVPPSEPTRHPMNYFFEGWSFSTCTTLSCPWGLLPLAKCRRRWVAGGCDLAHSSWVFVAAWWREVLVQIPMASFTCSVTLTFCIFVPMLLLLSVFHL